MPERAQSFIGNTTFRRFGAFGIIVGMLLSFASARGQVVINEFAYDDSGPDDLEYVELFNTESSSVDLSGWILDTGGVVPGPQYELPEGTVIAPKAYLLLGSLSVPNVDVALGTTDLFGDGPGYITLMEDPGVVVDGVVYEANKGLAGFPPEATEEGGIWGNHVLVSATQLSWQRWFDGYDTDENGADFGQLPWTPGSTNDRSEAPRFASDFEATLPGLALEQFPGSFARAVVVEPMAASNSNPNVIPESPGGGNALVAWDPAGGGNFVALEAAPIADMMFEAWVYFDANLEAIDESETWSLGLRGTSGTFYNIPVIFDSNGNTGVTWTYQVTSSSATLYLIDEGSGGLITERVQLGSIPIVPGENDGWQRLRLEVDGDEVTGYFGGSYGSTDDGIRIDGATETELIGNFYIGYREAVTNESSVRPPTIDDLDVRPLGEETPRFRRASPNADAIVDLTDAVFLLNFLFLGGPEPTCEKSADTDDSGTLEITDGVSILNFLFLGGEPPQSPFGDCGSDATPDELSCESFAACEP